MCSMPSASMMSDNMTCVNQNEMNIVGLPSSMNGNGMNVWYNCFEYPIFPMCIYYE